jgi:hypothetical protein
VQSQKSLAQIVIAEYRIGEERHPGPAATHRRRHLTELVRTGVKHPVLRQLLTVLRF